MSSATYNKIKIDFWDVKQVEAATLRVMIYFYTFALLLVTSLSFLTFSFLFSLKLTSFVIGCKQVPVVIIALILLWGIDLWILDKLRIQFHSPLSIKSPNLTFVFTTGIFLAAHFAFHVKLFSSSAIGLPFASEVAIYYCALLVLYFIPGIPVSIQ
jgi:hypothetical protein